jgi:hypothetical protein
MERMKPMTPLSPMEPIQPMDSWWPMDLGEPTSAGGQNDMQYAYFKSIHRLLLREGSRISAYDTGDHEIYGVSQSSESQHPVFTSVRGDVDLSQLTRL